MALRELLHDRLDMVAIFSPVAPSVIAAFPAAVAAHVASPAGRELRRVKGRGQAWKHVSASTASRLALRVVSTVDSPSSNNELIMIAGDRGYSGLPINILAGHGQLIAMLPHDLFDGTAGWRHIAQIAARASGLEVQTTDSPSLRFPVLSMLKHSNLLSRDALSSIRTERRQAEQSTSVEAQFPAGFTIERDKRERALSTIQLTADDLALIDSTVSQQQAAAEPGGRATSTMKQIEVVLAAASAALDDNHDYRVRMAIDLRRYTPRKTTVLGPFSTAFPLGLLRASDNTAVAMSKRLAAIVSSKAPIAALVGDLIGLAKLRVRHPLGLPKGSAIATSIDLTISVLPSQLPEAFWGAGPRTSAAAQLHPIAAISPLIQLARIGDELTISIWDEVGAIDCAAFTAALHSELAARVPTSSLAAATHRKENQS